MAHNSITFPFPWDSMTRSMASKRFFSCVAQIEAHQLGQGLHVGYAVYEVFILLAELAVLSQQGCPILLRLHGRLQ